MKTSFSPMRVKTGRDSRAISLQYPVNVRNRANRSTRVYMYNVSVWVTVCSVALPCCLFDLACFFLPSFSSLIKTYMYIHLYMSCDLSLQPLKCPQSWLRPLSGTRWWTPIATTPTTGTPSLTRWPGCSLREGYVLTATH